MDANRNRSSRLRPVVRPLVGTALLLLIPLVMTIHDRDKPAGDGWHWAPASFLAMGALLFGAGVAYELLASSMRARVGKVAVGILLASLVFAAWFELAVDGVSKGLAWMGGSR
jgi:hypothetical protein